MNKRIELNQRMQVEKTGREYILLKRSLLDSRGQQHYPGQMSFLYQERTVDLVLIKKIFSKVFLR